MATAADFHIPPPPVYEYAPQVTPQNRQPKSDGLSCESICRIATAVAVMFIGFSVVLASPPGAFLLDALFVTVIGGPMVYMLLGENECTPDVAHCLCDLFSHMAVATVQSHVAPVHQTVHNVHQNQPTARGYAAPTRMPGNPTNPGYTATSRAPAFPGNPLIQN